MSVPAAFPPPHSLYHVQYKRFPPMLSRHLPCQHRVCQQTQGEKIQKPWFRTAAYGSSQIVFIKYLFTYPFPPPSSLFAFLLPAETNCVDLIDQNMIMGYVDLDVCQAIAANRTLAPKFHWTRKVLRQHSSSPSSPCDLESCEFVFEPIGRCIHCIIASSHIIWA